MKDKSLVDRLTDVDASEGLGKALRKVIGSLEDLTPQLPDEELLVKLADLVDCLYIERARWNDGTTVFKDQTFKVNGETRKINLISTCAVLDNGYTVYGEDFADYVRDTQEAIDCESQFEPWEYVSEILHMTGETNPEEERQMMIDDLLRRQRELDGRE